MARQTASTITLGSIGSAVWLVTAWLVPAMAADAQRAMPNIVLIVTDDQGWWDMGAHGNATISTPVMDRLTAEGVSFSRFYATPVCAPTRAGLMTGRHHHRTGAIDTYMGRDTLDPAEVTLGQIMQRRGYRTGLVGKWHLGRYRRYHPNLRGFSEFFGFWQYGYVNRYDDPDELFHQAEPVITTGYITDVLTEAATEFIRADRLQPFFLALCYNAPHSPYLVPDRYIEPYLAKGLPLSQARVYGMITCLDDNLGRLLAVLDETGIAQDTVVIFMSDNGGVSSYFKAGLRGQKGTVYEGGIRVPFIVRWSGRLPAGARIEGMAQHIDVLPTLCELTGADLPSDRPIDGRSLWPLIQQGSGASPHEYLFHQWCRVRPDASKGWAVHHGRHKLVNGELYDLEADPGEKTDLANQRPELVRPLREAFLKWFEEVTAGRDDGPPAIQVGREDENPVELDIAWARLIGESPGLHYQFRSYYRDVIIDWRKADEGLAWSIDVTRPGGYEVILQYACPPHEAGSLVRVSVGDAALDTVIEATAAQDVYRPVTIGTLTLAAGPATLEMRPVAVAGGELMRLNRVWLRRVP
ncbi:MAG: sulfatase-like hydrolase/transferase [Phycisphaerae bacterium]|mgnify:FL=1|nr:sulfatase-like hydrolase/transferase [Phycisphaerae bacterium]